MFHLFPATKPETLYYVYVLTKKSWKLPASNGRCEDFHNSLGIKVMLSHYNGLQIHEKIIREIDAILPAVKGEMPE